MRQGMITSLISNFSKAFAIFFLWCMNDIYAYDPDTEEEAGQCMDEVIQIAEESGAEIQFY